MRSETAPPLTALAAAQIATLNGIAETLAWRPDIAPLLKYMFDNLSQPLSGRSAPYTAMDTLAKAFRDNGARVALSDSGHEYGLDVSFRGGCGLLWIHAPAGEAAAEAVVEPEPDAPAGDADNAETRVLPDAPVEDAVEDVDVLAESAVAA